MLLKVEAIEEIGRFAALRHRAPHFGRLSLVFARNGYGKSTISSVLRSVAEQDPKLIEARRKLGAIAESRVHLSWQGGTAVTFTTGQWNLCPGQIHVFDHEYVRRNLHVGESVTRDNKRSLLPVVLGDGGVALIDRISALDAEQRELGQQQLATDRAIKAACPVVTDVGPFANAVVPTEIDQQIEAAEKQVELARHALAVRQKPDLALIPVPVVVDLVALAARGVEAVSEEVGVIVKNHIEAHGMVPNGARWLEYGVTHQQGDECPFCKQNVVGNPTVEAFKGYFSASFATLVADIDRALEALEANYGPDGTSLAQRIDLNAADLAFWKTVCDLPEGDPLPQNERDGVVLAYAALIDLLKRKRAHPLGVATLPDEAVVLKSISDLAAYQLRLAACTVSIAIARSETEGSDQTRAQEILERCRLSWNRRIPLVCGL